MEEATGFVMTWDIWMAIVIFAISVAVGIFALKTL